MFGTSVIYAVSLCCVRKTCFSTHVQHGGIIDVHSLLRICRAVFVVEVDAGIIDKHVYASVLRDIFRKIPDTTAV